MPQPKKPMTAAKPAVKPAAKPAVKPAAKPAAKAPAKPAAKAPAKSSVDSAEMKFKADSIAFNNKMLEMGKDLKRQILSDNEDSIDSARTSAIEMTKELRKMQAKYPGRQVF